MGYPDGLGWPVRTGCTGEGPRESLAKLGLFGHPRACPHGGPSGNPGLHVAREACDPEFAHMRRIARMLLGSCAHVARVGCAGCPAARSLATSRVRVIHLHGWIAMLVTHMPKVVYACRTCLPSSHWTSDLSLCFVIDRVACPILD